ncbi:MAG TPA: hypothetical protein VHP33_33350 [Polyangiaceae bacterium]|nr:hypothetical protein [Polyangiaceae bacterium]
MPQLAEAEAPAPAPASPSCAEGYKPSTQFVRKPWLDAYEAVRKLTNIWVDGDDPTTAEEARDGLCLQSSGIVGMPPNLKSTCKGDYWVISTDHDYYTDHTFVIVPRGPEAVLFDAGLIGGGLCTGEQSSTLSSLEVELHGNALHVRLRGENNEWSPDSASGGVCERSHTDVADYTYDLKTNLGCEAFHVE